MAVNFRGYLFQDDGDAVNGATVQLLETGTTTVEASTTTNSDGLWYFSESDQDRYDVKIASGTSVRYIRWDDQISLKEIDARNNTGNTTPAATFTNLTNNAANQVAVFSGANSTKADNDEIYLSFKLADSAGNIDEFARMTVVATDVTTTTEDGQIEFDVMKAGTLTKVWTITSSAAGAMSFDMNVDALTIGSGADTDVSLTFDANSADGVITWMEDEDYFKFSDDILVNSTERINFYDTAIYIYSSTDGQLDLVADTEIQIAATTIDINGAVAFDGALTGITNITLSGTLSDGNYTFDTSGNVSGLGTVGSGAITSSGIIKTDNTTEATSTTDGSLQTDGGLSVAKDAVFGDDVFLLSDSAVFNMGAGNDFTITHDGTTGATLAGNPITITASGASTWSTSSGALTITSAAAATWSTAAGALTIDGDDGITLQTTGSGNVTVSEILDITDATDSSDATGDTGALRTEGGASIAKKLYVGTDLDVDGTTNLDAVDIDGNVQADGTITVGVDDTGYDVKFFGATASAYMLWDASADDLVLAGAAGIDLAGDIDVDGTTNLDAVDIDGNVQLDGTLTVGVDDTGLDVKFFGATAGKYMLWDQSADDLILASGVGLVLDGSGNEKIESDGTDISISVGSGGDINIPADVGLTFGDDGEKIEGDGTDLTISSSNKINLTPSNNTFVSIANNTGLIVGHTAQVNAGAYSELQVLGGSAADASLLIGRFSDDASGPALRFIKSRHGTIDSKAIVEDGDSLGEIIWKADDGVNFLTTAASIKAEVDGTPGANDMPTALLFNTTPDGSDAKKERMVIRADGKTIVHVPAVNATSIDRPLIVMAEDAANAANLVAGSGTGIEFRIPGAHDSLQETYAAYTAASIDAIRETAPDSESDASLSFKVSQNDTTLDEAMRITSDGGVYMFDLLAASASTDVNINGSDELHSVTSSEYYKYDKRSLDIDSSLIYQLEPRSYRFGEKKPDAPESFPESEGEYEDFGLTAEEVHRVLPELVNMREGKPYSVRYSMLSVLLLNEIKKLRAATLV